MKIITINMKPDYTLPFRLYRSNFLSSKGVKKTLGFLLLGFLTVFMGSCSRLNDVESIEVEIWHNGSPLNCNAFDSHQQVWSIQQLAFFISNVKLYDEATVYEPQLSSTPWQTDNVVLIQPNLNDCAPKSEDENIPVPEDSGASETLKSNDSLQFLLPVDLDASKQLSFTLAVPFELNHQNPLMQPSPLNLPSMFWSWRSGHKFFRLDLQASDKNWVFHLGSLGCTAVSTMRSPQSECVQPNRVDFQLDKKHNGTTLVMHIDRLIANISMQNNDSCLFQLGQDSCSILMSNLKTQDVFEWH
ncbi:MbnP family copper-binding protein [Paraglaciecola sp. MB-3u-78]|uniref:MbnP family copper-binding protein n=1 Tax=Paraglaciecola sp. MB-3u-78 TaxID=2058332 RepID=UPI001E3EA44B|nr:MbnP family copper-binding protein [Paraglaciecola sp. MB-3u-78]